MCKDKSFVVVGCFAAAIQHKTRKGAIYIKAAEIWKAISKQFVSADVVANWLYTSASENRFIRSYWVYPVIFHM